MIDQATKEKIIARLSVLSREVLENLVYDEAYEEEDFVELAEQIKADEFMCGRTKLVIKYNDVDDYVVKIPIRAQFDEDGDAITYMFADAADNNDYCQAEADIYAKTEMYGVQDMFAGTWHLCDIDGMPIYISEKAEDDFSCYFFGNKERFPFREKDDVCNQLETLGLSRGTILSLEAVDMLLQQNGDELVKKLYEFIDEYDITDLHSGNIGYMPDKRVVLLDYSSFND